MRSFFVDFGWNPRYHRITELTRVECMICTCAKRRRKSNLALIGTKRRVRTNMGCCFEKKVEVNGEIALHEGYIYHGYLQIACVDLQKPFQTAKCTTPSSGSSITIGDLSADFACIDNNSKNECKCCYNKHNNKA